MNADSNAPKLAKRSLRPGDALSSTRRFSVAHGDVTSVDAQQSGAGPGVVSSDMMLPRVLGFYCFFFHLGFESMLGDCRFQLFDCDLLLIESDKQQIQVVVRFQFPFPLVFDRLDTVKL